MFRASSLVLCLMLGGCSYQTASSWDIDRATKFCADKSGIVHIVVPAAGTEVVLCRNGDSTNLSKVEL